MKRIPTEKQIKYWKSLKGKTFVNSGQFKKGYKQSKEMIEKSKDGWKKKRESGWKNPLKGRKLPESHIKKISENNSKYWKGKKRPEISGKNSNFFGQDNSKEKNSRWLGGKSFEEYTLDWTQTLKRSIRERDKYICQLCSEVQGDIALDVHHIDYNKKNCNPENLITLCRKCHMKTNYKRDYWLNYFKNKHYGKQ